VPKVDFIYKEIELMDGHIIEPCRNKRPCYCLAKVPGEAIAAFAQLKKTLMAPPVLGILDPKEKYLLKVDASDTAIGAELMQHQYDEAAKEKRIRLITAVSRILTDAEVKWSVHEREGLAIIWALEKLKTYLVNAKFKICTDHWNLLWLLMTNRGERKTCAVGHHNVPMGHSIKATEGNSGPPEPPEVFGIQ